MFRLIDIELHKLRNSRASKVLIVTYFVLLTSIALIAAIKFDIGPVQFHLAEQGIFNFPYIWHFNTFIAAFFKFFLLLVIVSMMANEYSNKTLKQNLIDGLSKKEFVLEQILHGDPLRLDLNPFRIRSFDDPGTHLFGLQRVFDHLL